MNKSQIHNYWKIVSRLQPWYFLGLAVLAGVICLLSLRSNNVQMIKLRDAVYTADKNNGDVETSLRNLRTYVYGHMNTSLASGPNAVHPPIQLKYKYERIEAAQQAELSKTNTELYNQAQHYCEQQNAVDFSGHNRVPCIESYVLSHGTSITPIPDALYKFDFTSAKWSPDLAGWSMVVTILSAIAFVCSALYHWWAKKYFQS